VAAFPEKLAAHTACRVIVWSRAGYGGSEPYPEARTERYMHREGEEMLPALVAALGIEKPILIGHSDGGSIALICAGARPELPLAVAVMAPHEFVEAETLAGIRAARKVWDRNRLAAKARPPSPGCAARVQRLERLLAVAGLPRLEHRGLPAQNHLPGARHPGRGRRIRHHAPDRRDCRKSAGNGC
jgi:pimeloyl-ACP methyl ester carboxylesterase